MTMGLYFSLALMLFAVIVLCISVEHFIAAHWFQKDSLIMRMLRNFEKKHPDLCDDKDVFYCFFKRDAFTKH